MAGTSLNPLLAPLLQEQVPVQEIIRTTGLPGFEADVELLIDNFCWQVLNGALPSLDMFKQIWKVTSFSFIHQAMPPVLQPWDYQQLLYSAALNRLDDPVGPFLSQALEQAQLLEQAAPSPSTPGLLCLPSLAPPTQPQDQLPTSSAVATVHRAAAPPPQPQPAEHVLLPPPQLPQPPAELDIIPLDVPCSPTHSLGTLLDDLPVMSPTRGMQALPSMLPPDSAQHAQHQEAEGLPSACPNQPATAPSCLDDQHQQGPTPTYLDGGTAALAPHPMQPPPAPAQPTPAQQQPASHLCHDHMLQQPVQLITHPGPAPDAQQVVQHQQLIRQLASSIGAVYCLYCLHATQPTTPPCNIYLPLQLLDLLAGLVQQLQQLGLSTPIRVLQKLWSQNAFMVGQLRKPKHGSYTPAGGPSAAPAGSKAGGAGIASNPILMQSQPLRDALLHVKTRLPTITDLNRLASVHNTYTHARQQVFQPLNQHAGSSTQAGLEPDQALPYLHETGFADDFKGLVEALSRGVWSALAGQAPAKQRRKVGKKPGKKRAGRGHKGSDEEDKGEDVEEVDQAGVQGADLGPGAVDLGRLTGVFGDLMRHQARVSSSGAKPGGQGPGAGQGSTPSRGGAARAGVGVAGSGAVTTAVAQSSKQKRPTRDRGKDQPASAFEKRIQRELREAGLLLGDASQTQDGDDADGAWDVGCGVWGQGQAAEVVRRTAQRQAAAIEQAGGLLTRYHHMLRATGEEEWDEDVPDLQALVTQHTAAAAAARASAQPSAAAAPEHSAQGNASSGHAGEPDQGEPQASTAADASKRSQQPAAESGQRTEPAKSRRLQSRGAASQSPLTQQQQAMPHSAQAVTRTGKAAGRARRGLGGQEVAGNKSTDTQTPPDQPMSTDVARTRAAARNKRTKAQASASAEEQSGHDSGAGGRKRVKLQSVQATGVRTGDGQEGPGQSDASKPTQAPEPSAAPADIVGKVSSSADGGSDEDELLLQGIHAIAAKAAHLHQAVTSQAARLSASLPATTSQPCPSPLEPEAPKTQQLAAQAAPSSSRPTGTPAGLPPPAGLPSMLPRNLIQAVMDEDEVQLGLETAFEMGWVDGVQVDAGQGARGTSSHYADDEGEDLSEILTDDEVAEHVIGPVTLPQADTGPEMHAAAKQDEQAGVAQGVSELGAAEVCTYAGAGAGAAAGAGADMTAGSGVEHVAAAAAGCSAVAAAPAGVAMAIDDGEDDDDDELLQQVAELRARASQGLRDVAPSMTS